MIFYKQNKKTPKTYKIRCNLFCMKKKIQQQPWFYNLSQFLAGIVLN